MSTPAQSLDTTSWRRGAGNVAVVFVHGFLDDGHVWNRTIAALTTPGIETVQVDLAGSGGRADATGPFTYARFAADVGAVVDRLHKPFVIVGQSMGAPIAELVAAARPERALGLVLVAPVPLAGTQLPDEVIEPFRALGGDAGAQRGVRRQLAVNLSDDDLDHLAISGLRLAPATAAALVDAWNVGHADVSERSRYAGPVLILPGAGDGFSTEGLVATAVAPRFADAQTVVIDGAGHWPHVEQPEAVAAQLDAFLAAHPVKTAADAWTNAFADRSAAAFGAAFADNVVFEASILTRPIAGRDAVMQVMGAASQIYEFVEFTHRAHAGPRSYLQWRAGAFDGMAMNGVTILTMDAAGRIVHFAIHHRPLGAVQRFSAELGDRLEGIIDRDYFNEPTAVAEGSR
jgi:pimeloyl-ACP methyl ester carboxylesterase